MFLLEEASKKARTDRRQYGLKVPVGIVSFGIDRYEIYRSSLK